jgi:hypothetical protein
MLIFITYNINHTKRDYRGKNTLNKFQHLVAALKEDVNEENSSVLRIFDKGLHLLFSLVLFGCIPYFLYIML